jgi:hypothetical protein
MGVVGGNNFGAHRMKKLFYEPVFHFALLGVALFVYFSLVNDGRPVTGPSQQIVISDTDLRSMIEQHRSVWRRPPTELELTALLDASIREEVLVREALELGLDRGDAAIRNRLAQKMRFLTESAVQMLEPDDDALRTHMQDNPDQFKRPARVAFEQIYLGDNVSKNDVEKVRAQLEAGADLHSLGRGGLLPASLPVSTPQQVDGTFGTGFFASVFDAEPDTWSGPVRSGYGWHLVRVSERQIAAVADIDEMRDDVLSHWRRNEAEALTQRQYGILRERYDVVLPSAATRKEALTQ